MTDHRIAVIGAGMAGLACARVLQQAGYGVEVIDKGRGPGGRMSTRRGADGLTFDHGAQYVTARSVAFQAEVEALEAAGAVAVWRPVLRSLPDGAEAGRHSTRYVGVPGMNAVIRALAEPVAPRFGVRAGTLAPSPAGWTVATEAGDTLGPYAGVAVAIPAPQAAELLGTAPGLDPVLAESARAARLAPCWTVMAVPDAPVEAGIDAAFVTEGPLSWIARNTSKPGRAAQEAWVLHASPDWSAEHLERSPDQVAPELWAAFRALTGAAADPGHLAGHRWRYARVVAPVGRDCLWDDTAKVGVCGDWCLGERVEDAWTSGTALGRAMAAALG